MRLRGLQLDASLIAALTLRLPSPLAGSPSDFEPIHAVEVMR